MRKTKAVKIDDREYIIQELRVKDIRKLINSQGDLSLESVTSLIPSTINATLADLEDLSPSELKILYSAWEEVNSDFLEILTKTGVLSAIKNRFLKVLTLLHSDLSSGGMDKQSGAMGTMPFDLQ